MDAKYHLEEPNATTRRPRRKHDTALQTIVGSRIRDERLARNYGVQTLGNMAIFNGGHISYIERGLSNPTIETVFKLAGAMDVRPASLFVGMDEAMLERAERWYQGTLDPSTLSDDEMRLCALVVLMTAKPKRLAAIKKRIAKLPSMKGGAK